MSASADYKGRPWAKTHAEFTVQREEHRLATDPVYATAMAHHQVASAERWKETKACLDARPAYVSPDEIIDELRKKIAVMKRELDEYRHLVPHFHIVRNEL